MKVLLLEAVVEAAGAAAAVVVMVPNWKVLPVLGAEAELVLVVDGVDQFPKRDFTAGCAAGCVVVMELEEAIPVVVLLKPGKTDGADVVLLIGPPNINVLLEETIGVVLMVVSDGGCPKPAPAVAPPKMGLKSWTGGLLSGVDVAEEAVVMAKMGLNPEASTGFVLLTDLEVLAGAPGAVTGLEAVEAEGVLFWLASPNRPATGGVPLVALGN